MSILPSSRRIRALAMVPVFVFLVAAKTSVAPVPETMVPADTEIPLGEPVTVKEGDVVLRAKIYDTEVATLTEPVSVAIARFSHDIEAGTRLDPVIAPRETEQLTGTGGMIYCGENQRTRSQFMEAMIGDWFSKFDTVVRFCFVDTDKDGKLDRVFLAGAKDEDDQAAVEIEPVAFERRTFRPEDEADILELRVDRLIRKRNRDDKIEFRLHLIRDGNETIFSYLASSDGGPIEETYPTFKTDPRRVPYPSRFPDVLGASISVLGVDAEQGTAQIRIDRRFSTRLVKPVSIQYNYVYVYY